MLNIFSLICICLNYVLYLNNSFLAKLHEGYAIFNPIVDVMPVIPLFIFLSLCLASYCKFSIKS